MEKTQRGRLIVFEGLDGSGKGTQIAMLEEALRKQGRNVYVTAEPTASSTGGLLRDALGGHTRRDAYELSALFLADRIFHNVNPVNGMEQYISQGIDVLCDRYYYSSFAYQGMDADLEWVMKLNLDCREIRRPDLCIFLDVSPQQCDERIAKGRLSREIYETLETQQRIRARFFEVFDLLGDTENIRIINASRPADEIAGDIIRLLS